MKSPGKILLERHQGFCRSKPAASGGSKPIRNIAAALSCAAGLLLYGLTSASGSDIAISQAWSRATPKGATVAAGYLSIRNNGRSADRLLSASAPIAGRVEIHEMLEADGIITMRPMKGLMLAPNGKLILAPGGNHLMFWELRAPFLEGDHVPVSLDFEKAGKIDVLLDVGGIGANGPHLNATSEEAVRPTVSDPDPFFIHICGTRVMANVTVSPGRSGPVEVLVQLEDVQENALPAEGLSVTLSNPDGTVAPITTSAVRTAGDTWRALMLVPEAGKWDLALRIAVTPTDKIEITAPVLIE